ncbi:ABC transporter permease [Ruminococcus sp.]|uniref:ABC transporter permease n=1 Tax=Ruminococcus sp. TaxID=41978 RepID=UPI0025FE2691|nr:ABC transporter permease [Ruminococcus sp.]
MQVFKAFMRILKTKLPTAMIYLVVFMVMAIAMANSSEETQDYEDYKMDIAVIDRDDSELSGRLADFVYDSNTKVDITDSKDDILDAIYYTRADYVLIIKEGFADKIAAGDFDGLFENYKLPSSYNGELFDSRLEGFLGCVRSYMAAGEDADSAFSKAQQAVTIDTKAEIKSFDEESKSDMPKIFRTYNQYLAYIFVSILIGALCPVLLVMNKKDIRARTACSSISATSQALQTALGAAIFVIATWVIFTVAGFFITGMEFNTKVLLAALNSFVLILVAAGIALVISTFSVSDNALNLIANVVGLGMSFLCGVFVPQEILSDGVLTAGRFLPAYWFVKANNMISNAGGEVYKSGEFFGCVGIELLFAVALFAVAMLLMRVKRREADQL